MPATTKPVPVLAALGLAVLLGACGTPSAGPGPQSGPDAAEPGSSPAAVVETVDDGTLIRAQLERRPALLADRLADPDPATRIAAVRALGRMGGDDAAATAAGFLADADPGVREAAAFAVGASGSDRAPQLLEAAWPSDAAADTTDLVNAAAMGLGFCRVPEAESLLVSFGVRPDQPANVPAALFSHYRWRKEPAPKNLPDGRLLAYRDHADPAGRAGLGALGRTLKDPGMLDALIALTSDPEWEVRRAAVLGLADGRKNDEKPELATKRLQPDAARAVAALRRLVRDEQDPDPRVVVAAIRALGSYKDAPERLLAGRGLIHRDHNVRAAAAATIGSFAGQPTPGGAKFRAADLEIALGAQIREDLGPGGRYAAAVALSKLDPVGAQEFVASLLKSTLEYDRVAAVEILSAGAPDASTPRLAALSVSDPNMRVRESALDALAGREGEVVAGAVIHCLASSDPVLVAYACDVAAKNELTDLYDGIRFVPERFPGALGTDAREGAISAIASLKRPEDRGWVEGFADDPSVVVRWAVLRALAGYAEAEAPDPRAPSVRQTTAALDPKTAAALPLLTAGTTLVVVTEAGTFSILLDPARAPIHCAHVVALAREGFYDGLTFHRVVPDFVVQGGCPRGDGSGSAGVTLPLEPTDIPFERGTLGMPRSSHPDSGGCQLFICHSRAPHLDLHYTAFGRVVEGIDVIDRIDVDTVIRRITVKGLR